jgi:hypothetical protein
MLFRFAGLGRCAGLQLSVVMTPLESPNRLNEQQKTDYDLKWEC